ncbi:MAG: VWA domain-containing protein [Pyrinomonadaceae bacterium]|nr:VWA domain-containing protein [Pyrinomonadaceae bacterium]
MKNNSVNFIFAVFVILFSSFVVFAQDDVLKVDTTLVKLNIGVVDVKGKPILNLNKNDFTIYEDDTKQNILRFEPTLAPFSVVVMLDMSGSTIGFRQTLTQAALRFLDTLAPDDRVAVVAFSDKTELLIGFTSNRKEIAYAISIAKGRGKTQLYKALDFSLDKLAKENTQRKAIVVLTDGVDSSLREQDRTVLNKITDENQFATAIKPENNQTLNQILSFSDKQGVTIYPLALPTGDPSKLPDPTPMQFAMYSAARERLNILATRTGGRLNAIVRLEDMGRLYASVAAEIRTLYSVEYQSTNDRPKSGEKFRTIKLEVNRPELIARTRTGYYAK